MSRVPVKVQGSRTISEVLVEWFFGICRTRAHVVEDAVSHVDNDNDNAEQDEHSSECEVVRRMSTRSECVGHCVGSWVCMHAAARIGR